MLMEKIRKQLIFSLPVRIFLFLARCRDNSADRPGLCNSHLPFIGEVTDTGSRLSRTFSEPPYSESRHSYHTQGTHTWHLTIVPSREQNFKIDQLSAVGIRVAPNTLCGRQGGNETRSILVKNIIFLCGRQETVTLTSDVTYAPTSYVSQRSLGLSVGSVAGTGFAKRVGCGLAKMIAW